MPLISLVTYLPLDSQNMSQKALLQIGVKISLGSSQGDTSMNIT